MSFFTVKTLKLFDILIVAVVVLLLIVIVKRHFIDMSHEKVHWQLTPQVSTEYKQAIFNMQKLNYASAKYQHAISLLQISDHKLLAAWYAGVKEHTPSVHIVLAEYNISTQQWSEPKSIISTAMLAQQEQRYAHTLGNPILARVGNHIDLFFESTFGGWATSRLQLMTSFDLGKHWSAPRELYTSAFFNVSTLLKGTPLHYTNGDLVLPAYSELFSTHGQMLVLGNNDKIKMQRNISWDKYSLQPVIIALNSNKALALLRYKGKPPHRLEASVTDDAGLHWKSIGKTIIPNPNSAISALLHNGKILLALNPTTVGRSILALATVAPDLKSWQIIKYIKRAKGKSYSYPYLIKLISGSFMLGFSAPTGMRALQFNSQWMETNAF